MGKSRPVWGDSIGSWGSLHCGEFKSKTSNKATGICQNVSAPGSRSSHYLMKKKILVVDFLTDSTTTSMASYIAKRLFSRTTVRLDTLALVEGVSNGISPASLFTITAATQIGEPVTAIVLAVMAIQLQKQSPKPRVFQSVSCQR